MSSDLTATEGSPHLHDLDNEVALLFVAVHDFPAYQAWGIDPRDYYADFHVKIARAAEAVHEERGKPDPSMITFLEVTAELDLLTHEERTRAYEKFADPPLATVPSVERLKRQRRGREAIWALLRAARRVGTGEVDEGLCDAVAVAEESRQRLDEQVRMRSFRDMAGPWLEGQDARADGTGISLGLPLLKRNVGTLMPGRVLVIGAQTGNGKTSFVQEILCAAADEGTHGALISMEDDEDVSMTRWVAAFAGVPPRMFEEGQHRDVAMRGLEALMKYDQKVYFHDCIDGTEQQVMAAMTVAARRGVRLVVVDYIGEVAASVKQQDRRNEVRWIVTRLKAHARRIGVALILISQLSRPKDGNLHREPTKHDLKEAGDVENAAEYVLLLWRDAEHDYAPVHVKLAKSKTGGTGREWWMQREVFAEHGGQRVPGSARLREVVEKRESPADYRFPLLERTYEALLAELYRDR